MISKDIGQGAFQLELPKGWIIHNMFNKNLLIQCREPQFKGQHIELTLLPNIVNKGKEYEIKEIRKYRKQGQGTQFLVYWKGYRDKHDQWIVETVLPHAKEMIKDYWSRILS